MQINISTQEKIAILSEVLRQARKNLEQHEKEEERDALENITDTIESS